jgi:protein-L-isoaspartate(D-aspartate) O-methyltransferase
MGISDDAVLHAIGEVPRHLFFETLFDQVAYEDKALPIICGQTISKPSTVAYQSQLLSVKPGMKVMEVGTGSGYQTAVLCELKTKVFTIERQKELFDLTRPRLAKMGYDAQCFLGDGFVGLPEYAMFDRIIITCGAPFVPPGLLSQLKVGGVMVIPVGEKNQEMLRIIKNGEGPNDFEQQKFGDCSFVPMLQKLDYGSSKTL